VVVVVVVVWGGGVRDVGGSWVGVRLVRSVRGARGEISRRRHPGWIWRRSCCTRAVVCDSEGDNQRTLSKN
jgi:hypothetical protein